MEEKVILVDSLDRELGEMEKMEAHLKGELHRAISVIVFNSRNEMLLQQRAFSKYHTPGLWSNTCCSHPRPGENVEKAANRRLLEEMGFQCHLVKAFDFVYKASFSNGLIEHEFDHVFIGAFDQNPSVNPEEAHAFRWITIDSLKKEMKATPEAFTIWFRLIIDQMEQQNPEVVKQILHLNN